jgi:glutathione S-transferase
VSTDRLWQFRRSPYNEKARWALDRAGAPYHRRTVVPGPHALALLWTFQTKTPVLERESGRIVGSSAVVRAVAPDLVPADPAAEREATRVERVFDADLTPRMRRAVLGALLSDPEAFVETFAGDEDAAGQARYRRAMGVVAKIVRLANGISVASVEDGMRAIEEALALVARASAESGYLVGSSFTIADLTAAASLGAVLEPAHADASYGPRGRAAMAALRSRFEPHDGSRWVHRVYREHRPPPCAL